MRADAFADGSFVLVRDIAEDLVENILARDEPLERSIFVHDQGKMRSSLAKYGQLFLKRGGVRHKPRLRDQRDNVDARERSFMPYVFPQDILEMQNTNDIVGCVPPDWHASMIGCDQFVENPLGGLTHIDGHHIFSVNHDIADLEFAQVEHAAQHVPVLAFHTALAVMHFDGAADLLVRLDYRLQLLPGDAK